jgi:pimeloyl-ACP methyl ester carboxylesterase
MAPSAAAVPADAAPAVREATLQLSDGRTLHYQECGDLTAGYPTFVFHGALGTGDFSMHAALFHELGAHAICPTLPGWGPSSPVAERSLLDWPRDILALADHLQIPATQTFDVVGISLGANHALACAIRLPDRVRKCLAMGGQAPYNDPAFDAFEGMDMPMRVGVSAFSVAVPVLSKLAAWWVARETRQNAEQFVRENLLTDLCPEDRRYWDSLTPEQQQAFLASLSAGVQKSLAHHHSGYTELARLLRTWAPTDLAEIRDGGRQVMIVGAEQDAYAPFSHARYFALKLPAASFVSLPGGHISLVFEFPQIFRRFILWDPLNDAAPAE